MNFPSSHEFRWTRPAWQAPVGNGLVAVVSRNEAIRGWADGLLLRNGDRQCVWVGLGSNPEQRAWKVVQSFGLGAASLVAGRVDSRQAALALQVAAWLSQRRIADQATGACWGRTSLTSWSRPTPPPGVVRVFHLVSVRHGVDVFDTVVWELVDPTWAKANMRLPPDLEYWESHLETLLWLRTAARTNQLPVTPSTRWLLDLICTCGPDLSTELVYRHAELFRELLNASGDIRSRKVHGGHVA